MATAPQAPDVQIEQQYSQEGAMIVSQLRAIVVSDQQTYDQAADMLVKRAAWKKKVVEFFAPMKKASHDAWKTIVARETLVLDGENGANEEAEKLTRDSLATFDDAQERLRKQQELEAAEKQREIDDAARESAAKQAKALGAGEEAVQQIREAQLPVSPPKVAPTYRKSSNINTSDKWKWRTASTPQAALSTLVKAAARNPALLVYLTLNEKQLDSTATIQKSSASVPGIVFFPKKSVSVRSGK